MEKLVNTVKSFLKDKNIDSGTLFSVIQPIDKIKFSSVLNKLQTGNEIFFYSERPNEEFIFIGIESTFEISIQGDNRVAETAEKINKIERNFVSNWDEYSISLPLFLGGMKFSVDNSDDLWDEFSDSDWFIPKFLFIKMKDQTYLLTNIFGYSVLDGSYEKGFNKVSEMMHNGLNEENEEITNRIVSTNKDNIEEKINWNNKVNEALTKIDSGDIQKVVLSRQIEFELENSGKISCIVTKLARKYPRCYIFAFRKNGSIFFGASPEKLAKISHGWIEADALAGSISRSSDPEEDKDLADELLSSRKNLEEHLVVVSFIENSFSKFCDKIIYDKNPIIRQLPNIQHLWTPIKARLESPKSIFAILEEIHPTPAICGVPWTNALYSIKEMENHNRGLFSGMIGWFNFNNEGEFVVAIRSALMKGKTVYAFSGCGIVNGSDPENEFEESELKLKPILSLFEDEAVYQS